MQRRALVLAAYVVAATCLVVPAPVRADGTAGDRRADAKPEGKKPPGCSTTQKRAAELEDAGWLREAREMYRRCMVPACGSMERTCGIAVIRLDGEIPSVTPVVSDIAGVPVTDVEVTMDGQPFAQTLDGRALAVDPGVHAFVFRRGGVVFATRKVMIVQGQHGPLSVSYQPGWPPPGRAESATEPEPAEPPKPRSTLETVLPYAALGLGVLGVGTGALFTYWGKTDNDQLAKCSPNCSAGAVAHVNNMYVAADVSFGVGVAALGAGAVLWFVQRANSPATPTSTGYLLDVHPSPNGAYAAIGRSF
jgi:hypothetical protein